jgi:hypothetical protein
VSRDTGNTTADNSNGITEESPTIVSQTFVWNWFWNCASDEGVPAVPAPPAGATTIVLNWHWACADAPPPLDIAGVTVCTSCNIAISVRIGSPGDGGDVTQSIAATTAAAASNVADTIQAALQSAIPPPALQAANPAPDAAAAAAAAPLAALEAATYRLDDGVFVAAIVQSPADDLPRHGAPASFGGAGPPQTLSPAHMHRRARLTVSVATVSAARARVTQIHRWAVRLTVVTSAIAASAGHVPASGPRGPGPPAPAPSAPTPFIISAGAPTTHDGGSNVVTALAAGLALTLLYALFTALRLPPVVPPARAAGANPHPPG